MKIRRTGKLEQKREGRTKRKINKRRKGKRRKKRRRKLAKEGTGSGDR